MYQCREHEMVVWRRHIDRLGLQQIHRRKQYVRAVAETLQTESQHLSQRDSSDAA